MANEVLILHRKRAPQADLLTVECVFFKVLDAPILRDGSPYVPMQSLRLPDVAALKLTTAQRDAIDAGTVLWKADTVLCKGGDTRQEVRQKIRRQYRIWADSIEATVADEVSDVGVWLDVE